MGPFETSGDVLGCRPAHVCWVETSNTAQYPTMQKPVSHSRESVWLQISIVPGRKPHLRAFQVCLWHMDSFHPQRGVGSPISLFPPVSLNEIVLFTENLLSAFNTNMNDKNNVL